MVYFFLRSVTMKMPVRLKMVPSDLSFAFCFLPPDSPLPKLAPQRPISVSTLDHSEEYAGATVLD